MATMSEPIEWVEVPPEFGSGLPNGSCNAAGERGVICGYPRRADGTCLNGHPAAPEQARRSGWEFQGDTRDNPPPAKPGDTWVLDGHPRLRMTEAGEWVPEAWQHEVTR